jgi:hypothetical protein
MVSADVVTCQPRPVPHDHCEPIWPWFHQERHPAHRAAPKLRSVVTKRMRVGPPRPDRAGRPSTAADPGRRTGERHPTRRDRIPARGTGGDTDRAAPGRTAHPGPHRAQHQLHRAHDRILSPPPTVTSNAGEMADGAALMRGGHGRSRQAVPSGQTAISISGHCDPHSNGMSLPKRPSQRAQAHRQRRL